MLTALQRNTLVRMTSIRSSILRRHPFYGQLMMNLKFGTAPCGTACTDMEHLIFDPEFAGELSDEEMSFVMMHEVLHCVLKHCLRSREFDNQLFNVACDIVVNSNILHAMNRTDFEVAGENAMHITPDGREGYMCTAEEVYKMLIQSEKGDQGVPMSGKSCKGSGDKDENSGERAGNKCGSGGLLDDHSTWKDVDAETTNLSDKWDIATAEAAKKASQGCSAASIPPSVREYLLNLERAARVDWRRVLQEFIQLYSERFDYSFTPADRRFSAEDYIIPAFTEAEDEMLEKLWFCVDTSGSISAGTLSEIMSEILLAIQMFEKLSGRISFFDTGITEPVPFEDADEFKDIQPQGGGGTSFNIIFKYMKKHMQEDLPVAIIVLTDGYCNYPKEEAAMDVPVLWIIYDNPEDAPWGKTVHVDREEDRGR